MRKICTMIKYRRNVNNRLKDFEKAIIILCIWFLYLKCIICEIDFENKYKALEKNSTTTMPWCFKGFANFTSFMSSNLISRGCQKKREMGLINGQMKNLLNIVEVNLAIVISNIFFEFCSSLTCSLHFLSKRMILFIVDDHTDCLPTTQKIEDCIYEIYIRFFFVARLYC